jgi:hypothetical protein
MQSDGIVANLIHSIKDSKRKYNSSPLLQYNTLANSVQINRNP